MKKNIELTYCILKKNMYQRKARVSFVINYWKIFQYISSFRESLALQLTQCLVATTLLASKSETKPVNSSTDHTKLRMPQMLTITFGLQYLTLRDTVAKFEDILELSKSL